MPRSKTAQSDAFLHAVTKHACPPPVGETVAAGDRVNSSAYHITSCRELASYRTRVIAENASCGNVAGSTGGMAVQAKAWLV